MSYTLKLTPIAIEDIEFHKRSGDKATLKKLSVLFDEFDGTSKDRDRETRRNEIQLYRLLVKTNKQ